jgi:hypothetical protein
VTDNTETEETSSNTVTDGNTVTGDENSVLRVKTRYHSVLSLSETEKQAKERIFEHTDQKKGVVVPMGESEVRRRVRIYTKRVHEAETKQLEMILKQEPADVLEKQKTVIGNNRKQLGYWETALSQVTTGTSTETGSNTVTETETIKLSLAA